MPASLVCTKSMGTLGERLVENWRDASEEHARITAVVSGVKTKHIFWSAFPTTVTSQEDVS